MFHRFPEKLVPAMITSYPFVAWTDNLLNGLDFLGWESTFPAISKWIMCPWILVGWTFIVCFLLGLLQKRFFGCEYSRFIIALQQANTSISRHTKERVYTKIAADAEIEILDAHGKVNYDALSDAVRTIVNYSYNNKEKSWCEFIYRSIQNFVAGSWLALPNAIIFLVYAGLNPESGLFMKAVMLFVLFGVTVLFSKRILRAVEDWYAHKLIRLYVSIKNR